MALSTHYSGIYTQSALSGCLLISAFILVPLEAVSPILSTNYCWEDDIDTFWSACRTVFYRPERSQLCGSHIHVSAGHQQKFDLPKLRALAFGVIYYETAVYSLLPSCRQNNKYCQLNSERSEALKAREDVFESDAQAIWATRTAIQGIDNRYDLRDFMQKSMNPETDRYVLWNFDNILPGRSGTVEFRGGEGLEGPVETKRWIAFVVAFVHLCVNKVSGLSRATVLASELTCAPSDLTPSIISKGQI